MKKYGKRIIPIILVITLSITWISMPNGRIKSYAEETIKAGQWSETAIRGVADTLEDLPQYGDPDYLSKARGTAERPFLIVEIVPYEEYGEFGYNIGGCEPVAIEKMHGRNDINSVQSMGASVVTPKIAYFFTDEPGSDASLYDSAPQSQHWYSFDLKGYYELVEEGTGNFRQVPITPEAAGLMTTETEETETTETETTETETTETQQLETETTEPETQQPETQQPETETTEPETQQPEATEPKPETTETQQPETQQPETETTEPETQQPETTEPKPETTEPKPETTGTQQPETEATESQETETKEPEAKEPENKALQTTDTEAAEKQVDAGNTQIKQEDRSGAAEEKKQSEEDASVVKNDTPAKVRSANGEEVIADFLEEETTEESGDTEESTEAAVSLQTDTIPDTHQKIVFENKINDMLKAAGQDMEIVPEVGGNLIWHSVQDFELEKYTAQGIDFTDSKGKVLVNVGDRIYTTRTSSPTDAAVMIQPYYLYENNETFLTKTLGLSAEEAANYSVLVKTITPGELNANQEWVDYADLFYVSPKTHVDAVKDLWKKYRRLEHKQPASEYRANQFEYDDLDWETTLKLYHKINAKTNYAPIIMDDNTFNYIGNTSESIITNKTLKTGIRLKVYDWNLKPAMESTGGTPNVTIKGSNNNVWKLAIMLLCMDANLFQNLYLKGDDPIVRDGLCTLQEGDAAEYWNVETFFLLKPGKNTWDYWDSEEFWESFHSARYYTSGEYKYWVNGRVFTFVGDTSVSQSFDTEIGTNKNKFKEYYEWLQGKKPSASSAIEFILSYGENTEETNAGRLRVLDLEPSVGLNDDSFRTLNWGGLTETYLYMLIPSFEGDVEVVHQTTAEFIGKTEDLVSSYDMIYLGLDCGAYHTQQKNVQLSSGWVSLNVPDWNDNNKDGLIYLHSGDAVKSTETVDALGNRSTKWLWSWKWNEDVVNADTLYFAGNDISKNKQEDLENFVLSGHPVVAEEYLYNLERALIDPAAYICNFINWAKRQGQGLYSATDSDGIKEAVMRTLIDSAHVEFTQLPPEYNGTTADGASAQVTAPNYLPTDGSGTPYLAFGFSTDAEGYAYNVYVDQNRDGKLDWTEKAVDQAPAAAGANSFGCQIVGWKQTVGQVLWKIEVYNAANPAISYTRSGCSAVGSASTRLGRKEVNVLQIMPKDSAADGAYQGELNLEQSELFRKYYENLADYHVTVKTITADEYESYFYAQTTDASGRVTKTSYGFSYNSTSGEVLNEDKLQGGLANYDIMVVGFGKDYAQRNLDNTYGAVDYMRYFQSQTDRSIIFTHDVTSMYNLASGANKPTGYTANMLLRDIMGMNRYRSINKQATAEMKAALRDYQQKHFYDVLWYTGRADRGQDKSAEYQQNHGYTYYTMKRIAGAGGYGMPYRYLTGFNDNEDLTTRAVKVNEGQIASYPYKIDNEIEIAPTHAQWYQLNPEDEDLTVWYCLAADGSIADTNGGGSLIYQVSPKDAMNNYYAYSKGNVYYSGIGHSDGVGDMEAKLFVNTLIAAYRDNDREDLNVTYEPPEIEITNLEKIEVEQPDGVNRREYSIEQISSFDGETDGFYDIEEVDSEEAEESYIDIHFKPVDENGMPVQLECTIQYTNESGYAVPVPQEQVQGVGVQSEGDGKFTNLQNGQEYVLKYPKKYLVDDEAGRKAMRTISFEIKNDLAEEVGTTIVRITLQPLFPLD